MVANYYAVIFLMFDMSFFLVGYTLLVPKSYIVSRDNYHTNWIKLYHFLIMVYGTIYIFILGIEDLRVATHNND